MIKKSIMSQNSEPPQKKRGRNIFYMTDFGVIKHLLCKREGQKKDQAKNFVSNLHKCLLLLCPFQNLHTHDSFKCTLANHDSQIQNRYEIYIFSDMKHEIGLEFIKILSEENFLGYGLCFS